MINKQNLATVGVDQHAIRHEVLRWCGGLDVPEDLAARVDPREHICLVFNLEVVEWCNLVDQRPNGFSHSRIIARSSGRSGSQIHVLATRAASE